MAFASYILAPLTLFGGLLFWPLSRICGVFSRSDPWLDFSQPPGIINGLGSTVKPFGGRLYLDSFLG